MHMRLIHSLNCITLFSTAQLQDGFCFTKYVSPDACAINSFAELYNFIQYCSAAQLQDGFCFVKHVSQLLCTQQACEVIGFVDWRERFDI